jgi:membrane protease YdiL (CAAX protease family)
MYIVSNLIVWVVALVCGIIAENVVITRIFGISPYVASFQGLPQVWLARFLEPLVSLSILTLWLRRNGEDWHSLGLRKPSSWSRFSMQVILAVIGLESVVLLFMFGVVYPFQFHTPAPPDVRDGRTLAAALSFTLLGTGLNQELHFRGFLQSRFVKLFGGSKNAWHGAIAVTGIVFGLFHLGLSPANAVLAGLAGIFLGEIYLWSEKNLWVVVAAHSIGNAMLLIYWYWNP